MNDPRPYSPAAFGLLLPCLLLAGCVAEGPDSEMLLLDDDAQVDDFDRPDVSEDLTASPDATEASPGFALTIAKNGADIELSWADQGAGVGYGVMSSPNPYFDENDPDVRRESPKITATQYTLVGANDGTTRYYRILTNQSGLSSTVGQMTIALEPNYSILPLCLDGDIDDSNDLLADIGSATAQAAVQWDAAAQDWNIEGPGSASPLPLTLGRSIAIEHPAAGTPSPSTYTWVGTVPGTHELSVPLLVGENKVTTPLHMAPGMMASDLLPFVPGGVRVGMWDNTALDYHWYPDDGDFPVPPCSDIRLDVNAPSTFPDCDPASLQLGASTDDNWYAGGPRDDEQGTHGIGMGDCPAGYAVVGLKAYEGGGSDCTDGIGVHCREVTLDQDVLTFGADAYFNWYTGGPRDDEQGTHGGDPGTGECPAGSIVAGVQYFEGGGSDWVDGIGVLCRELTWNGASFTYGSGTTDNWYYGGARGAEQGTHGVGMGECAHGQVVTGIQQFEGGGSDWVDGIGVRCRDLDVDNVCF